jgi:hypothetical protein
MPTWADRYPFLTSAGKKKMRERYEACLPSISSGLNIPLADLQAAKQLGCGNYGCTFLVPGLVVDRSVLKVTSDNLEAHVVQLLTEWGEDKPEGIVHYGGIWQLGDCSTAGKKLRQFCYKRAMTREEREKVGAHPRGYLTDEDFKKTECLPGPRPVWLIQREELPDVHSHFKGRLKTKVTGEYWKAPDKDKPESLQDFLYLLNSWARSRAFDWGLPGFRQNIPHYNEDPVREAAEKFHGVALMDALDWLMERSIAYFDFQKIVNLGWREGTGLVIRDIGFASTEMNSEEDPKRLNGYGEDPEGSLEIVTADNFPDEPFGYGDISAQLDVNRDEILQRFKAAAARVWGDNAVFSTQFFVASEEPRTQDNGLPVYAAIMHSDGCKPRASGRHLIQRCSGYKLLVSDRLLLQPDDMIEKVLLHEAIHMGHWKHTQEFREVAREVGAAVSGSAAEAGQNVIKVQKKVGARYQTVKTFEDEDEATTWAKEQIKSEGGSWRLLM